MKLKNQIHAAIAVSIAAIAMAPNAKAIDVYYSGGTWKVRWADGRAISNSSGNFFRGLEAATAALDAERPDRTGPQGVNVVAPAGTYNVGTGPANIRTGNVDMNFGKSSGVRLNLSGGGLVNFGNGNNINVRNVDVVGLTTIATSVIFSNSCNNMIFENISVRTTGGVIGLRPQGNYNVSTGWISNISVRGTCTFTGMGPGAHGIETMAINNFSCPATVNTSDTGGCGVLLNKTRTATINTVNAVRANQVATSTGSTYSALRFANDCSNSSQYGITVERLIARDCGRGFALLTSSGAHHIKLKSVDISNSSNFGILLSSFVANGSPVHNFSVDGGRITGCGSTGLDIDDVTDSQFSNLDIYGNFYGLDVTTRAARLSFNNVQVHDNTRAGAIHWPAITSSINSDLTN